MLGLSKKTVTLAPDASTNAKAGKQKLPGITARERSRMAQRPPSFTDLLPWMECDAEGVFLLEDGVSRGVMYELDPIPTEATSETYLSARMRDVQSALSTLAEYDDAQWVVQFYVNDDTGLDLLLDQFRDYVLDANAGNPKRGHDILNSACTRAFMRELAAHLKAVSVEKGFFVDEGVSGNAWRGQIRRVRMALYRRYPDKYDFGHDVFTPAELLKQTADGLIAGLREAGIRGRRMKAVDFYNWLVPFFNPKPFGEVATTVSEILRRCPYPDEAPDDQPFGVDLGDLLMHK